MLGLGPSTQRSQRAGNLATGGRWREIGILRCMIRPCFLVIDREFPGNISTRKLVIETALLNVITAYSAEEGLETLVRFPRIDGIVLDSEMPGQTCLQLVEKLRKIRSDVPIVTVSPSGQDRCGLEDYHASSYDPRELLEQLHKISPEKEREAMDENGSSPEGSSLS